MPLLIAGIPTLLLLIPILATNAQDGKMGSPLAWLFVLGVGLAHLPLVWDIPVLRRWLGRKEIEVADPSLSNWPRRLLVAGLVAITIVLLVHGCQLIDGLYASPVDSHDGSRLALMSQVSNRLLEGLPTYRVTYPMGHFESRNLFAPGMPLPFAMVRSLGLDWRFANLGALILLLPILAAGVLMLFHASGKMPSTQRAMMLAGFPALAVGWLLLPLGAQYLIGGHTPPIWPFILLFALALSARAHLLAALSLSVLASMSVGWLLLVPLYLAILWVEERRLAPACTLLTLIVPGLLYGLQSREFDQLIRSVLGGLLIDGNFHADQGLSHRLPILTGLWDFLAIRSLLFVLVLMALMRIGMILLEPDLSRRRRIELFAFAAFLVIYASPVAFYYHYYAHLLLLGGLMPGWVESRNQFPTRPRTALQLALPLALLLLAALIPAWRLSRNAQSTVDRVGGPRLLDVLGAGWHPAGEDHVWGATLRPTLNLPLGSNAPAVLKLHLGALENPAGRANTIRIWVNGRPMQQWSAENDTFEVVTLRCEAGELFTGTNSIALEADWMDSPSSLGIGHDDRLLSIYFGGLEYTPMTHTP